MTTVAYLKELTNAQSIEALWHMHCEKMAEYGFDRLIYGFTHFRSGQNFGDPEDFVLLTNHPKDYTDVYIGKGLYFHAPMTHWALNNVGACSWRVLGQMVAKGVMTEDEKKVVAFNMKMHVTAGYTVSFNAISPRSKGAIALAARRGIFQDQVDEIWAEHGADILVMNNVAHLKITTLPHAGPTRGLTKRQREALEWVGDGKTTQDIAVLMGLTPATVEKHLRLAREVLNVETTAQAVMKAALQNQMFIL